MYNVKYYRPEKVKGGVPYRRILQARKIIIFQHFVLVSMDTSTIAEKLSQLPSNITWLSITEYDKIKDDRHYLATRVGNWNSTDGASSVIQFEVSGNRFIRKPP